MSANKGQIPANRKFSNEQLIEDLKNGMTVRAISDKYSVALRSVQRRKAELKAKGFSMDHPGWDTSVPDGFRIKGRSIMKDAHGNVIQQWEKSTIDAERQEEILKAILEALKKELPKYEPEKRLYSKEDTEDRSMVVLPIGDLHCGMLSWKDETGANWDLKICEQAVYHAFKRVIDASPIAKQCVIINCGDFFHADNMQGTTARSGNILDTDSRFSNMIQVGVRLIRQVIYFALQKFESVRVINVSGNHDMCSSLTLSILLKNVYEKDKRVIIDDSPTPIHYVKFGKVLIAATHGDTIKMEALAGVVSEDRSRDWGETRFRYGITGHIHSKKVHEAPGMLVESFRTLAPNDSYATWYGFRSGRDTQAIVYDKDHGEQQRYIIGISIIEEFLKGKS